MGERGLGIHASALDGLQQLTVGLELQLAFEEVIAVGIDIALLEGVPLFLDLEDLGLLNHFVLVLGREAADGHQ